MIYKLEISSENFNTDTICMGWQLANILKDFVNLKNITWLVFDVYGSTHGDLLELFKKDKQKTVHFEDTKQLISSVSEVVQFETGVFCLVDKSEKIEFTKGVPETEAKEGIQIQKAILEIRTFDYSFFEVYSTDKKYLDKIKKKLPNQKDLDCKTI
jgi:hypoxanthine phosphoribosyltransferase